MYTNFSSATALNRRARWSFYDGYGYGSQFCPRICSQSYLCAVARNPGFVYHGYVLKRHSRLFQLEPSRTFPLPRRMIRVRVCDGGLDESIGMLGECARCCYRCRCCKGEGFGLDNGYLKQSSKKEGSWTRFERKGLVTESWDGDVRDSSRKEGSWSRSSYDSVKDLGSLGDFECRGSLGGLRKKVVRDVRKYEGDENYRRGSRNEMNNRKDFDRIVRDDEERVTSRRGLGRENYNSENDLSFSGDFEEREVEGRRVIGEYSGSVKKKGYGGFDRIDEEEKVVREVRKHGDEEKFSRNLRNETNRKGFDRRLRVEEENVTSSRDSGCETGKDYVCEELEGSRKQMESLPNNSFDQRSRVEEENIDDRVDLGRQTREGYVREAYSDRDRYSAFRTGSDTRNVDRGESLTFMKRKSEVDQRVVEQADPRKSSLRSTNVERVSNSQRHLEEERVKKSVRVAREERTQIDQREDDKMEVKRQYDTNNSDSRILATDNDRTDNSKSYLEIRREADMAPSTRRRNEEEIIKVREDGSSSVEVRRDGSTHMNQQATNKMEFNEKYGNQTNLSQIYASDTEWSNNSKSSLCIRTDDREEHSTSVRDDSRVDSEWDSRVTEFRMGGVERISNLHEVSTIRTETQDKTSSSIMVHDKDNRQTSNLIADSSQSTERQMGARESFHGDSSFVYQERNDAIESASRLDESSAVHVGEFVNKLRQETSALDNSEGTFQETAVIELDVDVDIRRYKEKDREQGVRQSSSRSTMKGPSDEIWETSKIEETGENPSAVEVLDSKAYPSEISENAIIRRSHRSLWAYIADIMMIGLGRRARSSNSLRTSGTRSSSNESISSEAWFSGQEPEVGDDETHKKKDISPMEPGPLEKPVEQCQISLSMGVSHADEIELSQGEMQRQGILSSKTTSPSLTETGNDHMHRSSSPKSEEFDRQVVAGTGGSHGELRKRNGLPKESTPTISVETMRRDLTSKAEGSEGEKGQGSVLPHGGQSSVLPAVMASPSIPEIEIVQMHSSELSKLEETMEVGGTEGRDRELKRRKLQRNKQVLAEQFEEWEEAYKRESEQRKIDEFFMREALLDAKKAADTWEVPVGAVLVQNGKVIARGCNLVEELRDSTAHAEMICIREASNLLRTWRLAETTLYVTLEPCAMCAGAILQARIDTVVWGAPNKLLGADGSWVRLFPNGDGGSSSSFNPSTNQNAGPVHPFHPKITIRRGILPTECSDVMQQFFQLRRKNNKKQEQLSQSPSCLPTSHRPMKLFARMHDLFCMMFCL